MRQKILCLGEPLLEFNQNKTNYFKYLQGFGGDISNTAIAAARQGAEVGCLTAVGQDAFGEAFIKLWQSEGVDSDSVIRNADAHTGVYFVSHGDDGHEFTYLRSGSAAARMTPDDLDVSAIAAAAILHVSGISQAISDTAADTVFAAIDHAKANRTLVSYDTNLRLQLWGLERAKAIIHAALAKADLALPSYEDAVALTGLTDADAIVDFYLTLGVPNVVLKLGAEGVLIATADERCRVPGHRVTTVDATGAGDTFGGAFLAQFLLTTDLVAAAEYANAAAALSTQDYGAVAPMPKRDAVEAFISTADNSTLF